MEDLKDPAIKLFGHTIALPEGIEGNQQPDEAENVREDTAMEQAINEKVTCHEVANVEVTNLNADILPQPDNVEQKSLSAINSSNSDNHQSCIQDAQQTEYYKPDHDQESDASGQEKVLKRPDKILPCPRCNSMDTKFCYYNNYNVNQPRHFCKNCQRYWTAGGTMRNVPVGAGRRKNKHSSQYRQLMMSSDGMATDRVEAPDSALTTQHQVLPSGLPPPPQVSKVNGSVVKFGSEAPLCESVASVLNIGEQNRNAELGALDRVENTEEPSCASSVTASYSLEKELPGKLVHNEKNGLQSYCNGTTPVSPLQCYPGPPLVYPWGPCWNSIPAMAAAPFSSSAVHGTENASSIPVSWVPSPLMAAPAFCTTAIPFPFVPASLWGCMSSWPPGACNGPWIGANCGLSPSSSNSNRNCSGNGSRTLGKHSRDTGASGEEKAEKSLWFPKTLRIDDPDEAAKSSIWATLGIKLDEGGIFKSFPNKAEIKQQTSDSKQVLQANPAALSRSQKFQEST